LDLTARSKRVLKETLKKNPKLLTSGFKSTPKEEGGGDNGKVVAI